MPSAGCRPSIAMCIVLVYTKSMSFRGWLSIITFVLIGVILYFSRHELEHAWKLLEQVNIWILLALIPLQVVVYIAGGEMMFSYLRGNGKLRKKQSPMELASIALEGNFVNHVLPSGGVSGVSYLTWRLGHLGVSPGRATMSQVVRHAVGFMATAVLLMISVIAVTIDGDVNRWVILMSSLIISMMTLAILLTIFLLSSKRRIDRFAGWLSRFLDGATRRLTGGRKTSVVSQERLLEFFDDMHRDFLELRHDKKLLIKPFWWGMLFIALDAGLFFVTFLSLGYTVNPAVILIAYSVASVAGFFVLTPGGAGAYEATMVAFLTIAGLSSGTAIAGIVLARAVILITTIALGGILYQKALLRNGKRTP